jgi:hypothetical protein
MICRINPVSVFGAATANFDLRALEAFGVFGGGALRTGRTGRFAFAGAVFFAMPINSSTLWGYRHVTASQYLL